MSEMDAIAHVHRTIMARANSLANEGLSLPRRFFGLIPRRRHHEIEASVMELTLLSAALLNYAYEIQSGSTAKT